MTSDAPTASPGQNPPAQSSLLARISRKTLIRAITVAAILGAGTVGMHVLEASLHLTFDKPPMPLRKQLNQTSRHLGIGPRYIADRPDDTMEEDVLQVLGTKDYLLREYTDAKKDTNQPGSMLDLNVNYYSMGSATPHVPEICWAGSGLQEAQDLRRNFVVSGVHRADGTVEDIHMRLLSFSMPGTDSGDIAQKRKYRNVAYLFEVNGDCVVTPKEVISAFWKASNLHAYHTKIEVTIKEPCTQDEAQQAISDFMREAIPAVEECLPEKEAPGTNAPQAAGESGGISGNK